MIINCIYNTRRLLCCHMHVQKGLGGKRYVASSASKFGVTIMGLHVNFLEIKIVAKQNVNKKYIINI